MLEQIGPTEIILILLIVAVQIAIIGVVVYLAMRAWQSKRRPPSGEADSNRDL